jgi:hypothetical protein
MLAQVLSCVDLGRSPLTWREKSAFIAARVHLTCVRM